MTAGAFPNPSPLGAAPMGHSNDVSISLGAHTLFPTLCGALIWPDQETLIVSDMHLEKGSSYAASGQFLPPYDTRSTLRALATLLTLYRPNTVISLGDSVHDLAASRRIADADRDFLKTLVAGVRRWIWIEGNHDPDPPKDWGGQTARSVTLGGLEFRHIPSTGPIDAMAEISGHLHPCARIRRRGRSVRRRCFATDGRRLILPAYGAFAGGLNVCDPAYEAHFARRPDAYMLGRDQVWPVRAQHLRPDKWR